ncbi:flavonoid O-methyltransferase-like protein Os11g0303600 [Lolium rigidum]|uniref:flavonoid O-methyltransferase-like protein Os11g0303600 n=1 Tax=Lolium rigidum TaxID=89674 RepID=UPI001F5D0C11|nr:flavonoid O-methyltransferase-like protein Os11g0303600 [Lolium rigidum]
MALECAINLGLPNAIHRCGGAATLPDLLNSIAVPESKKAHLPRLMRFLSTVGIFSVDVPAAGEHGNGEATGIYGLTPVSRLLVDEVGPNQPCASLSAFVVSQTTKYHVTAATHLSEWFKSDDGAAAVEMPFRMAHGTDLWGVMDRDQNMNQVFNDGMGSDTKFAMDFIISNYGDLFEGITSLVDVAGGTGSAARAIAKAFPHIKCSVLDLPNVIHTIPSDDVVEYVAGDMMRSIPPTDVVFLKYVLHDWNDEDCVKILTECKKAIPESGGKVIIVDIVVGSHSNAMLEAQVTFDLLMMVITSGKERDEHEWRKIFMDAGFSHYKTRPVLGFMAITELYT